MKIAVGSDHRGFDAKQQTKSIVTQMGHECIDFGTDDTHPVDYPDLAYIVAKAVSEQQADRAILICATGLGMSIAANKVKGVRAALCHDELSAQISRDHNDTNVLCLSGDQIGEVLLRKIVEAWLSTEFSGGRHQRRVGKIMAIEEGRDPRELNSNG
jgi:ribose 5-phosphate isomerase B